MKSTDVAIVSLAGHGVRLPKTEDMVLLTGVVKPDTATWATSGIAVDPDRRRAREAKGGRHDTVEQHDDQRHPGADRASNTEVS